MQGFRFLHPIAVPGEQLEGGEGHQSGVLGPFSNLCFS